jgi:hypothetical protein
MNDHTPLRIRVLSAPRDLLAAWRLRHRAFARLGYLRPPPPSGIEIDAYDRCATALGVLDPAGALVATLRLVTDRPRAESAQIIDRVLADAGDEVLRLRVAAGRKSPVPSLSSDEVIGAVRALNARGAPVWELSRGVVEPPWAGLGIYRALTAVGVAQALCESSVAPVLIGSCVPEHVRLYGQCGFDPLPGSSAAHNSDVGVLGCCLALDTARMPPLMQARIAPLERLLRAGHDELLFFPSTRSIEPPNHRVPGGDPCPTSLASST